MSVSIVWAAVVFVLLRCTSLPARCPCSHVGAGIGLQFVNILGEFAQHTSAQACATLWHGSIQAVRDGDKHAETGLQSLRHADEYEQLHAWCFLLNVMRLHFKGMLTDPTGIRKCLIVVGLSCCCPVSFSILMSIMRVLSYSPRYHALFIFYIHMI